MDQADLRARVDAQDNKIASLEDRVSSLTSSLNAYKFLQNRFIRGGDAVVDASLYTGSERRQDPSAYERLYGMNLLRVLSISEFPL
ncbi:hypothetical protein BDD12DRAFT_871655 [Trichophaea hybrida]|nr:hypothetical protein BDD12DRAFT_871655 [Trichophaea hybrida]